MLRSIRRGLLLLVGILVLVGIAVAGATFFLVPHQEFQQWLGQEISRSLGEEIEFGSIAPAFWPSPGIRLYEIGLGVGEGAATVESVSCSLSLRALLRGEVVVRRINIERPVLGVKRDASGEWIFEATLQEIIDRATRAEGDRKEADLGPGGAPIPRLFVYDGSLEFADEHVEGGPVELSIRKITAEIDLAEADAPGRIQISFDTTAGAHLDVDATVEPREPGAPLGEAVLRAQVRGQSLTSDRFLPYLLFGLPIRNAEGAFDIDGSVSGRLAGDFEGHATLEVSKGTVEAWGIHAVSPVRITSDFAVRSGDFSLTGAHLVASAAGFDRFRGGPADAIFDWSGDTLTLEQLKLPGYGGAWTAKGTVGFEGAPSYDVAVKAEQVDFREFVSFLGEEEVTQGFETLDASADLRGRWPDSGEWWSGLAGAGTVRLTGGSLDSSPLYRSIFRALVIRIPGMSSLLNRDAVKRPNLLDHMSASFELEEGRAHTDDLAMSTSDYRLDGKGSVGLDGSVDLTTRVAFTSRGLNEFYRLASIRTRNPEDPNLPSIAVSVTGTFEEPKIVPDLAKLPLTPFRLLFDSAEGAVGLLKKVSRGGPIRTGIGRMFRGADSPPAAGESDPESGELEGEAPAPARD